MVYVSQRQKIDKANMGKTGKLEIMLSDFKNCPYYLK